MKIIFHCLSPFQVVPIHLVCIHELMLLLRMLLLLPPPSPSSPKQSPLHSAVFIVHRNFQCSVNCLPYGCTFSPLRLVPSKILNYVRRHRHRLFNLPIMQSNVDQGMIAIHYIVFVVTLSVACAMAHHAFTMGPFICCLFFLYLSQTV